MIVTVKCLAMMEGTPVGSGQQFNVDEGTSLEDLLRSLGLWPEVGDTSRYLVIHNGVGVEPVQVGKIWLRDGDAVLITPALAGG